MSKDTGCPISKVISIKEFHDDFKQENVIECSYYSITTNDVGPDISILTKSDKIKSQIIENCSLINLASETDKCLWDEIKIVKPRDKSDIEQFKTFEYFQSSLSENYSVNELMSNSNRKSNISKDLSYNNSREFTNPSSNVTDKLKFILDEVLITVILFKPLKNCCQNNDFLNQIRDLKPEYRIDLLGSQTLEDLLKMILCRNGESLLGDFSEIMNNWNNYKVQAKEAYKGGFFFIEDIFYDIEGGEDYSTPIIEWISKSPERIDQFGILEKKSMRNMRFIDMNVSIGKPYLYQHLGDCEHYFVFSDIRIINKHHCQDRNMYPIVTGKSVFKPLKCQFCETANSEWLVTDCTITPSEVTPMCDYCLRIYLYDENFKKIDNVGNFKVFKFPSFL